jgi:hypothetical protein
LSGCESWITKAKADEPLDTLTPPSESYDREEVVVLIGQAPQGIRGNTITFRDASGRLAGTATVKK